jgi:hypothetical protein
MMILKAPTISDRIKRYLYISVVLVLLFPLSYCTKNLQKEEIIYTNNFEKGDLSGISNGRVSTYDNSQVLGFFKNSGFSFKIDNIESHDYVEVSFNLYIHDNWIGNSLEGPGVTSPDLWQLTVGDSPIINTTFSNTTVFQSYPDGYKVDNPPMSNSFNTELPSICNVNNDVGTSMYKIVKTIKTPSSSFVFECRDVVSNPSAAVQNCKSWSVDNLVVKSIKFR